LHVSEYYQNDRSTTPSFRKLGQAYFSMPEERKRLRYSPGVT
jgi:hypothetical protein